MILTVFQNLADNMGRQIDLSWASFCERLKNPTISSEKNSGRLFSPARFNGKRCESNVIDLSALCLDFDGKVGIEEAYALFSRQNVSFALYTTYSHLRITDSHPEPTECFRIVVPLKKSIPASEFPNLWRYAFELTEGTIDPACKNSSRIWYPAIKATEDSPYECHFLDRQPLDWTKLPLEQFREAPVEKPKPPEISLPGSNPYAQRALESEITSLLDAPKGERNAALNSAAFSLFQFVAGGHLDHGEVSDKLERAARGIGLSDTEIRSTLRSASNAAASQPRVIPEREVPAAPLPQKPADEFIFDIGDAAEEIIRYRQERAAIEYISTGWPELDEFYSPIKGAFTIVTGNPNAGKTQVLDNMIVNIHRKYGWKFALVSFETQPIYLHMCVIASLFEGRPYSIHRPNHLSDADIRRVCNSLKGSFKFHLIPYEARTVSTVLSVVRKSLPLDGFVCDPYSEFSPDPGMRLNYLDFIRLTLPEIRAFTYENNLHTWLVAHPQKEDLRARSEGRERVIDLQDVSGGRFFQYVADFGITVHRKNKGSENDTTEVHITKCRREMPGRLGFVPFEWQPLGDYKVSKDYKKRESYNWRDSAKDEGEDF